MWSPSCSPKGIVALVHGLGSHSGLFETIVQRLIPEGYILYGLDLRGHGRSPGQRGYINSWEEFRGDLDCFLSHIIDAHYYHNPNTPTNKCGAAKHAKDLHQHPRLPLFVVGHSLGGVISLDYAMHNPEKLTGVVAIAPAIGCVGVPPIKLQISKMLSQIWPRFTLSTGLDHGAASRDPAIITRYQNDSLRHAKGTARLATEFMTTTRWIHNHASRLACPLLILHGGKDRVALPEGSDRFFNNVHFPDKTRHLYEESYHDLHNDTNSPKVLQDLVQWLQVKGAELTSSGPLSG
ncbi:MAG: lysophospholipase [Cyanobacteria bacterium P01_F01_bin.150]